MCVYGGTEVMHLLLMQKLLIARNSYDTFARHSYDVGLIVLFQRRRHSPIL